jgi:hypothetical protein
VYAASEPSSEPACQCSMSSFAADDRFPVEWMRAGFSQARKAVSIWTPSAPKASAALMPRASAMPPAAMSASVSMHSFRRLNESIDGNHLSNDPVPDQTIGATWLSLHCPTRHGEVVFQVTSSFVAQSVDLSV